MSKRWSRSWSPSASSTGARLSSSALRRYSAAGRISHREQAHLRTHPAAAACASSALWIPLRRPVCRYRRHSPGFEAIGGNACLPASGIKHAVRTYKANWYCDPGQHRFNEDIRDVTLSHLPEVSDEDAAQHIRQTIPQHDVPLAGFPCQPFSPPACRRRMPWSRSRLCLRNAGTLFLTWSDYRRPSAADFCSGERQNLKSHDKGRTFLYHYADAG